MVEVVRRVLHGLFRVGVVGERDLSEDLPDTRAIGSTRPTFL
jgi:hypothetical protein